MTTGELAGKVAAISGGSSGSGLAIAARFVDEGAVVVMLARGRERLDAVTGELGDRAIGLVTDVGDPASVQESFEQIAARFGRLDILINNAAVYRPCAVEKLSDYEIERQVSTNLLGPVYTCRAAIPLMRAAGGGDIVNTSSESTLHPFPMLSLYVATKSALEAFGNVLAQELRDDDIRVTTVVQGTAKGAGGGSTGWEWDPDHTAAAFELWQERGLLSEVQGKHGGQDVEAIGDVHLFIVTRPRSQRLDTVYCRSF
jgi:NAD(P)-dependent dehydrogenase (short-subunit alcohol dehydrogenase family)